MMTEQTAELEPKEQRLLTALLSEPTIARAAAGLSESTAYRYLKRPGFSAAYREARTESLSLATARLAQLASEAVETLGRNMNSPDAKPQDQISAARTVLSFAYRAEDLEALAVALEALKDEDV
jgi:hypothetical protein